MEANSNSSRGLSIDPGFDYLPKIDGLSAEEQKKANSLAFGAMITPIIIRQVQEESSELEAETADGG